MPHCLRWGGMASLLGGLGDRFPQHNRDLPSKAPPLAAGIFTEQKITAIRLDLIERTAKFKAVEHLGLDAVMKQQIEGFIGKKLRRQGQGPMGKPQAIENHPGHGFAWDNDLLLIW